MATALRSIQPGGETGRQRALSGDQPRRLRVMETEPGRAEEAGDIVERFPPRCARPRLTSPALARLIAEAEARLALEDSVLGQTLRARWPERRAAVPVLRPTPGLPAYAQATPGAAPNVVFSLFGRDPEGQCGAIERVLREQRGGQPFVPVFLTNDSDFSLLRQARLVFEYYPFVLDETAASPPADWAAYFLDALQLTLRRWGVGRIVQV